MDIEKNDSTQAFKLYIPAGMYSHLSDTGYFFGRAFQRRERIPETARGHDHLRVDPGGGHFHGRDPFHPTQKLHSEEQHGSAPRLGR